MGVLKREGVLGLCRAPSPLQCVPAHRGHPAAASIVRGQPGSGDRPGEAVRSEGQLGLPSSVRAAGRRGDRLALWRSGRSAGRGVRSRRGCTTHVVLWKRLTLRVVVGFGGGGGRRRQGGGAVRPAAATAGGGRQRTCHAEKRHGRCLTTAAAPCLGGGARRYAGRRVRPGLWWIVGSVGRGLSCLVAATSVAECVGGGGPGGAAGWPSSGD